ncbi:PHP domain-containing protein [Desulfonema ishimotonii]|uniref:Histidinol-phosphatase n=1 Tax=Desulfonema ishimotonii TaxID=45657 RepID=A0A401G4H3_9BACT|nr:histidinol-phosphatase [Desulfonema ishimotonii]GBC64132.1 PHP domain-containing protein [Desulfonema ishimotonii]
MTKAQITKNYHTHTWRCKHAEGDVTDYCRAATAAGITVLGITDHTPLPDNRWPSVRMDMAGLPAYCRAIDAARDRFPGLTVLKGLECEYDAAYENFYRDEILGRHGFGYLIGAVHYFPWDGQWMRIHCLRREEKMMAAYAEYFIRSMASGLFAFMAHPDAFGIFCPDWDAEAVACSREMLRAAESLGVPLEINAYGLRKRPIETPSGPRAPYPLMPFWELAAEYDIRVIVNSDAHRPADITGQTDRALEIADRFDLRLADLSHLTP